MKRAQRSPGKESPGARASLGLLLAQGGDPRIALDPVTRRNRYGMATTLVSGEIAFASTTANTISAAGYAAAARALDRLISPDPAFSLPVREWFDGIRASLAHSLGVPGCECVLAPSGTDTEILALGLACGLAGGRALTNIVIAPEETGSGVGLAAQGRHFAPAAALGGTVVQGDVIDGFAAYGIETASAPIRDGDDAPLEPAEIDAHATGLVERELGRGRSVLLHLLDTSKTGLPGLSREAAQALQARAPGRVRVVVDACQLRCGVNRIRGYLEDGFMVLVTGSKFAGGPAFCGAALLPQALADEIEAEGAPPAGIAGYSAALDWPARLRRRFAPIWTSHANIGLGLRWAAALDGIAAIAAISDDVRESIADHFTKEVRDRAANLSSIEFGHDRDNYLRGTGAIASLPVRGGQGPSALAAAKRIQAALRDDQHGPICHIGQAVTLKTVTVLRVAASAYTAADVAARLAEGSDLAHAFKPVAADLDRLFEKWACIERQLQSE